MVNSSPFSEQVPITLTAIGPVIQDLKGRPDAAEQSGAIQTFDNYRSLLQAYQAAPSESEANKIKTEKTGPVMQTTSDQIDANIAMSKMGQLNTQRIISPTTLLSYNDRLNTLYDALNIQLSASTESYLSAPTSFSGTNDSTTDSAPDFQNYEPVKVKVLPNDPDASPGTDTITVNKLKNAKQA